MRLLIDAGNTRLKWRLQEGDSVHHSGITDSGVHELLAEPSFPVDSLAHVALSTVASEQRRWQLQTSLRDALSVPVYCYWAERQRHGLVSAYVDTALMGADRWHAMYGAWLTHKRGFAVIDAGSAVTVDYVDSEGKHLGGYILPGLQMMMRSLKTDAARIGFDSNQGSEAVPGTNTAECVNHGLAWLWQAMIARIVADAERYGLSDVLVTGGDGPRLCDLGLEASLYPALVLDGLAAIDAEDVSV